MVTSGGQAKIKKKIMVVQDIHIVKIKIKKIVEIRGRYRKIGSR